MKLINENKKRFVNENELIDTREKCLKYLEKECETFLPCPQNWVKYCLGPELFLKMKDKYCYNKDELKEKCHLLGIFNFDEYKIKYTLCNKFPIPSYVNDGFYTDLDNKFNLDILLKLDDWELEI